MKPGRVNKKKKLDFVIVDKDTVGDGLKKG